MLYFLVCQLSLFSNKYFKHRLLVVYIHLFPCDVIICKHSPIQYEMHFSANLLFSFLHTIPYAMFVLHEHCLCDGQHFAGFSTTHYIMHEFDYKMKKIEKIVESRFVYPDCTLIYSLTIDSILIKLPSIFCLNYPR